MEQELHRFITMTIIRLAFIFVLSAFLCACGEEPPAEQQQIVRPIKTFRVDSGGAGGKRNFPARIDAGQKAELSFRVAGKVNELLVKEGDLVDQDQVVAKLDPTDYQIVVNDRKATFDNAKKNFNRGKELVDKGSISKMDYDRLEAEYKNAKSALESAQQDLNYTQLKVPFSGMIARRYIENFEEVQAKQTVLDLQNLHQLEVKFDVPESLLRTLRAKRESGSNGRVPVYASFNDLPGKQYPLTFSEASTKADEQTQTFQVTYTMDKINDATVLPGMTATVTADLSGIVDTSGTSVVPAKAVVGSAELKPMVWIIDETSMTVSAKPVKVGKMTGSQIEVLEGLSAGDLIASAGAAFLKEGMKVRLMEQKEQAEPRSDDIQYQ